jgi:acetolactate synthase-1/2/3 large subunit
MQQYRVADYVAEFIAKIGVKDVFLLPGGGAMHLVDAVGKSPQLNVIACQHEQAVAIAAEAYGRITENIGVAIVTTGPGATNTITAIAGAWIESIPLLIISGQVKRSDLLADSGLRQRGVQEVDIVSVVKPITKFAFTVMDPQEIRRVLEQAYFVAREGRAGPVLVDIPLDVQGAPISADELIGFDPPTVVSRAPIHQQVEELLELVRDSKRPIILAGHGVRLSGGAQVFRKVVAKLGIPVVSTWNASDLLYDDHPLYIGKPGAVALRAPNFAVQNSDLLISIGARLDNIVTAYHPEGFARGAKKAMIDIDAVELNKFQFLLDLKLQADAKQFLEALHSATQTNDSHSYKEWVAQCQGWKKRYPMNDGEPFQNNNKITHYQFVDALSEAIGEDITIITGSSGLAIEAFYSAFRNKKGQRIFLTSGLGAMGYGLPAAIGACVAGNKKPMIALESDGSLQLNIQELATIRANHLPIAIIVMNNEGYASIRSTQRNYFESRYVGTGKEAGLFFPELKNTAHTYEIGYIKIADPINLASQLSAALQLPSPIIIEVMLQTDENLSPKVAAIPQKNGSMLSMPLEDMSPLLPIQVLEKEMCIDLLPASYSARIL